MHGRQPLSFVNGSVAVSGYRRSSGLCGSAPWYCTIFLDHCSVRSASSKSGDLVSVLPLSYFYSIGHTSPLPHLVFVPWPGYSLHPPPGSVALASGRHSTHFLLGLVDSLGLTRHMFYHQPRDVVYMAPVLLPSSMILFHDVCSWGSSKAFVADGLSLVLLIQIWVFLVFLTVGFFLGFL